MVPASVERVDCPTCGEDVQVSLPTSAADVSVTATPDDERDAAVAAEPRTRRLSYSCPSGHDLYVYFSW